MGVEAAGAGAVNNGLSGPPEPEDTPMNGV